VADLMTIGHRFRTFNLVDDFNREAVQIKIGISIASARLVRLFEQLNRQHRLPHLIWVDNASEFLTSTFTAKAKAAEMAIKCSQPG